MPKALTTLFTGYNIIKLDSIDSTNSFLTGLLAEGNVPEGTAVVTKEQTAGRGQSSTSWSSEKSKNILASFVFYPSFLYVKDIFLLNKTFSLGVYDAVSMMIEKDVKIKWSNDIYIGDKKVCGMLVENSIRGSQISYSVLGIGLNVQQEIFAADIPNPTSLQLALKKEVVINDCLIDLCNCIESRYLQLKAGHYEKINKEYLQALYRLNENHFYESNGERFNAKLIDVNERGELCLLKDDGKVSQYDFKQVKFVI